MKNIVLLLLLASTIASAQPMLTSSTSNPVLGEHFLNYYCHVAGVPVGAGGAGVVWNYSTLVDSALDTISIVTCASTPYCDSLTPCTMVSENPGHVEGGLYCDASRWDNVNAAFTMYGTPFYQYTTLPINILKYPLSYGDSWHDTAIYRSPSAHYGMFVSRYHTVDGYGTLITPAGTFTNTLRVHVTDYYADTASSGLVYFREELYYWFTPGYHNPLLMIPQHFDSTTHLLHFGNIYFSSTGPLATANVETEQTHINVYPNPTNGILHFTSELKNCTAALTDITGRTVATARECFADGKGQIDVSGLPGGMYLLQLRNDAAVQTRKVVVGYKQ